MKVTIDEIVEALHEVGGILLTSKYTVLANRIEAHGIEQPSITALIAEAVATEREACAQICDPYTHGQWFAKHIRARGQK